MEDCQEMAGLQKHEFCRDMGKHQEGGTQMCGHWSPSCLPPLAHSCSEHWGSRQGSQLSVKCFFKRVELSLCCLREERGCTFPYFLTVFLQQQWEKWAPSPEPLLGNRSPPCSTTPALPLLMLLTQQQRKTKKGLGCLVEQCTGRVAQGVAVRPFSWRALVFGLN